MVPTPLIVLTQFEVLRPEYENTQAYGIEWLADAHATAEQTVRSQAGGSVAAEFDVVRFRELMRTLIARYGCSPAKIAKRGHALDDFCHQNWSEMRILNLRAHPTGASMAVRSAFYEECVNQLFERFYRDVEQPPADLIHVSCTGYVSPSGAQRLVEHKGWNQLTTVTHAYHMGCSAAVPALRLAAGFLATAFLTDGRLTGHKSRADIVHTELCTLHGNLSLHTPEQLVVQSLFADGFIKYSAVIRSEDESRSPCAPGLEILAIREEIVPDSAHAMTWRCTDWGMQMSLSRDVPTLVSGSIAKFLQGLAAQAGLDFPTDVPRCVFAVHPGGPKIIDTVQAQLSLQNWQVAASAQVLYDCGNMSSATLPHIWERILRDENVPDGTPVVSLAFGPGLNICGAVLRKMMQH